ncbi:MAG: ribonuclease III [Clostridiales bacterium]|nr:ribonuclease III [Clostridiales bacterium]
MEEGVTLLDTIKKEFDCGGVDIRTYSPLALAYIGDAIYDLVIRTVVVERANRPVRNLHKTTIQYVNAATQAKMIEALEDELSEEETAVYHRGRNAKPHTTAKNASIRDYRMATGLEALFGYLYLHGETDRLLELVRLAFEKIGMDI